MQNKPLGTLSIRHATSPLATLFTCPPWRRLTPILTPSLPRLSEAPSASMVSKVCSNACGTVWACAVARHVTAAGTLGRTMYPRKFLLRAQCVENVIAVSVSVSCAVAFTAEPVVEGHTRHSVRERPVAGASFRHAPWARRRKCYCRNAPALYQWVSLNHNKLGPLQFPRMWPRGSESRIPNKSMTLLTWDGESMCCGPRSTCVREGAVTFGETGHPVKGWKASWSIGGSRITRTPSELVTLIGRYY